MKKILKLLGVLIALVIIFTLYVMMTTGFFRSMSNDYSGEIINVPVVGAEDFAISRDDGFLIISSDDRAGRRDGQEIVSGLYYMDLNDRQYQPFLLEAKNGVTIYPHGISMIKIDSNSYRLLVVNHVSSSNEALGALDPTTVHSIEEYVLRDSVLSFVKTFSGAHIISPNDVVAIDDQRFYFTNDHGSKTHLGLVLEDNLGLKRSNVVYFDGANYHIVAENIAYANGINFDPERQLLYVASPRDFKVKVYMVKEDGTLDFQTDVDCGSGVDNIELDENGKIWIGSHPNLLAFADYAAGGNAIAPSEIVTIDYRSKEDYDVASVFESDGSDMSGTTTAIPYGDKVYVGNVMDDHFIILDKAALQ